MKKLLPILFLLGCQPMSQDNMVPLPRDTSSQMTRAGIPGPWVDITCASASSTASAQLNAWSRYVISCPGDSTRLAWGGSAVSAAASDPFITPGTWMAFSTSDTIRYVACRNVNADADCSISEWR